MIPLLADEPEPDPRASLVSLGYSIGPTCRDRLGITGRRAVRLARVRAGGGRPWTGGSPGEEWA